MLLLAIETTSDTCSTALVEAGGTRAERSFQHRMQLLERLIGEIDGMLRDAGVALRDVDAIAAGIGPGSFTGVRIGLMTAKSWAVALGKPGCGVSSLEAIASEIDAGPETLAAPVIRSRPGYVYTAAYRRAGACMECALEPVMVRAEDLGDTLAHLPERTCVLAGEGAERYAAEINGGMARHGFAWTSAPPAAPAAAAIARIAGMRLAGGAACDALAMEPLYIAQPHVDQRAERFGPRA